MKTLTEIADFYKTDKGTLFHNYTSIYESLFEPLRQLPLKILEIGIDRGYSLCMWREYFPNATIYGYDINKIKQRKARRWGSERLILYQGDQSKREDWNGFIQTHGADFDIIVDDGSHMSEHILISLGYLFPSVKSGGIYLIEDLGADMAQEAQNVLGSFKETQQIKTSHIYTSEQYYLCKHTRHCCFLEEEKKLFVLFKACFDHF